MSKILVFDNYDSFTYNLVHLVEKIAGGQVDVYRNDHISLVAVSDYERIILSPGPGLPSEAGLLIPLIREFAATKPILGVCLGHQAVAEAFGGKLENLTSVLHGVNTAVNISMDNDGLPKSPLFKELPSRINTGRYHSWIVSRDNFPAELEVTAEDDEGRIMAMQHRYYNLQSVQFHPESILTPDGEAILGNWLKT